MVPLFGLALHQFLRASLYSQFQPTGAPAVPARYAAKLDMRSCGGMCERLKQAVLKTAIRETVSGVRIPLPPPSSSGSFDSAQYFACGSRPQIGFNLKTLYGVSWIRFSSLRPTTWG
jgi:hypothetical protein